MRAYQIIISDETGTKRKTMASSSSGEDAESQKKNRTKKILISAYHYAKRGVEEATGYYVDTIELRTGSARAQQKAEFAQSVIKQVWSIGESLAIGAIMGGGVGAVVTAAVNLSAKTIQMAKASAEMNLSRAIENATLAQKAIRIGAGNERLGAVK